MKFLPSQNTRGATQELKRTLQTQVKSACLIFLSSILLLGCSNYFKTPLSLKKLKDLLAGNDTFDVKIANATLGASSGGNGGQEFTIFFDVSESEPITTFCTNSNTAGTVQGSACSVKYDWVEINSATGEAFNVPHTVLKPLSAIQNFSVRAEAPELLVQNQISSGTALKITVIATGGNPNSFLSSNYNFVVGQVNDPGDFASELGTQFSSVFRYACYEKQKRGAKVRSRADIQSVGSTNPQDIRIPLATQFCVDGKSNSSDPSCPSDSGFVKTSSQSYYYNLYVRSNQTGQINLSNTRYECPAVQEGTTTGSASNKKFFGDRTFSLSNTWTQDTPIGIQTYSVLGLGGGNSSSNNTFCKNISGADGQPAQPSTNNSIATQCIGYALRPNSDGTCGSFKDTAGVTRQTYRLRRYFIMYPPYYNTDGTVIPQPHSLDAVYVIDRPVQGSSDPLKPFTMHGPKPCNFAFHDPSGVLNLGTGPSYTPGCVSGPNHENNLRCLYEGGVPGWVASNRTGITSWDRKNIDGTRFPNFDRNEEPRSCSAAMPMVTYDSSGAAQFIYLGTSHSSNPAQVSIGNNEFIPLNDIQIRPFRRFVPHWEEDPQFNACAPLAESYLEAPLHFAKNSQGEIAWCSEIYPTQIPNPGALDRKHISADAEALNVGYMTNFTSHVVKRSSSPVCTASVDSINFPDYPSGFYPPAVPPGNTCGPGAQDFVYGAALHPPSLRVDRNGNTVFCANVTCDRTALSTLGGAEFTAIPLLAPPVDVEAMLREDPSYTCGITYDNNGGKKGRTPSSGCCNSASVQLAPGGGAGDPATDNAHLEPNTQCLAPNY